MSREGSHWDWRSAPAVELAFDGRCGRAVCIFLSSGTVQFVVANIGSPLRWISVGDRFTFWKGEVKVRLVPADAEKFYLDDYPGEYCYVATEWTRSPSQSTIVLLECHH